MDPFGHPAGAVTARCCADAASASRLCYLLRLGHGDGYSIVALGSGPHRLGRGIWGDEAVLGGEDDHLPPLASTKSRTLQNHADV